MNDDAELLCRYADEKSEAAFAELVRRHLPLVYHAALRQCGGDVHRAQDVAQTVFTDLARKAGALARRPVLAGWLYTSTRYAAAQAVRTEVRRQAREQEIHAMSEIFSNDERSADWSKLGPVIDDALHALNERDREAVLLRFFEGRAFSEVAVRLRTSEDAARMRVDRALDKLRTMLARRGLTSTGAALALALTNQVAAGVPAGLAKVIIGSALAGKAGAVGAITFMSISKLTAGIASVAALAAIGLGVYQTGALRHAERLAESLRGEREVLARRIEQSERQLNEARRAVAVTASADAKSAASAPAPTAVSAGQASMVDYIMAHPEMRPVFREQEGLRVRARFDRFFRAAGLSVEQQEEFVKQQVEFAEMRLDRMEMMRSLPEPQRSINGEQLDKQLAGERDQAMKKILGDDVSQQYAAYARTVQERGSVDQLAGRLYYTDSPLTAPQAEQLVQILLQDRLTARSAATGTVAGAPLPYRAYMEARIYATAQNAELTAMITDAAMAHAQSILSPAQLAALRQLQAQQVTQVKLSPPSH